MIKTYPAERLQGENIVSQLTKLLISVIVAICLFGCYDKGELKQTIQRHFDEGRAIKNAGDICYYLGNFYFPYTDEPVLASDDERTVINKENISKSLPLFVDIGLLSRKTTENNSYQYELTELGTEYLYTYPAHRTTPPFFSQAFCYGAIKVEKITDVTEKEVQVSGGVGSYGGTVTEVRVSYDYIVIDVPDWAINSEEKLKKIYGISVEIGSNKVSVEGVFLKRKDDSLRPLRGLRHSPLIPEKD